MGGDAQKAAVLERLDTHAKASAALLGEEAGGPVALLLTLHGAAEAAVDSICSYGAKDLRSPGAERCALGSRSLQASIAVG